MVTTTLPSGDATMASLAWSWIAQTAKHVIKRTTIFRILKVFWFFELQIYVFGTRMAKKLS